MCRCLSSVEVLLFVWVYITSGKLGVLIIIACVTIDRLSIIVMYHSVVCRSVVQLKQAMQLVGSLLFVQ